MADEGVGESANIEVKEHFDNAVVMLVLIALFVSAFMGVGRAVGRKYNKPGVTSFFGGS